MQKFKVIRPHDGDRPYAVGDIREANQAEVAHLIPHVLEPLVAEKAERPVSNKAEKPAKNKAG